MVNKDVIIMLGLIVCRVIRRYVRIIIDGEKYEQSYNKVAERINDSILNNEAFLL